MLADHFVGIDAFAAVEPFSAPTDHLVRAPTAVHGRSLGGAPISFVSLATALP